jgi:hypothetical protein
MPPKAKLKAVAQAASTARFVNVSRLSFINTAKLQTVAGPTPQNKSEQENPRNHREDRDRWPVATAGQASV